MRLDKYNRIINAAQYHQGPATVAHVLSTIITDPEIAALPGRVIGKIANIRHNAYREGVETQRIDTWAYNGELDWLAGIRGTDTVVEVDHDRVTITQHARTDREIKHIYTRQ